MGQSFSLSLGKKVMANHFWKILSKNYRDVCRQLPGVNTDSKAKINKIISILSIAYTVRPKEN